MNKSYLEKINNEKNDSLISLNLNKKIGYNFIIFGVCSLLFIIIKLMSSNPTLHDIQTNTINTFVNVIMRCSFVITILGGLILIVRLAFPKLFNKMDYLNYSIKKKIFSILDFGVIFPICSVIASFCFSFIFTFALVDGRSMMPTVSDKDRVFVVYNEKVERFDVVVAYITEQDNDLSFLPDSALKKYPEYYIKRVVGLPGDTVTWIDGVLTINGEIVDEYYFDEDTINSHCSNGGNNFNGCFTYKNDGINTPTYTIPDGYYFIMGDNRSDSIDSRMIGLVPKDNIEGIVKCKMGLFFPKEVIK